MHPSTLDTLGSSLTGVFAIFELLFSLMFDLLYVVGDIIGVLSTFAR